MAEWLRRQTVNLLGIQRWFESSSTQLLYFNVYNYQINIYRLIFYYFYLYKLTYYYNINLYIYIMLIYIYYYKMAWKVYMRLLLNNSVDIFNNDLLSNFSFTTFQVNHSANLDYTLILNDLIYLINGKDSLTWSNLLYTIKYDNFYLLFIFDYLHTWNTLFSILDFKINYFTNWTWWAINIWSLLSLDMLFILIYIYLFFFKLYGFYYTYNTYNTWIIFINHYIFSWLYGLKSAFESIEEVLCILILWPWCIFIIFSHIFGASNQTIFFGFAEWGLPVLYGLLLLLEHTWVFGTYIFVYLVGTRGRASLIVSFFEDIIAMLIMIVRVVLQSIRGLIVGMFHFICREALLTMSKWWNFDMISGRNTSFVNMRQGETLYFVNLFTDLILAFGSLVVVTAIMFLQLLFLLISVWLFCKCWFISYSNFNYTCMSKLPKNNGAASTTI